MIVKVSIRLPEVSISCCVNMLL